MINKVIVAVALLGVASAVYTDGPSVPIGDLTAADCYAGLLMADSENMCWYHQCIMISATEYELYARRCALGTKVPYDYVASPFNPCTHRFQGDYDYECSREQDTVQEVPACASELVCYNGGTLNYEGSTCWCTCPSDWQGDWLCSRPTGAWVGMVDGSNICVNGIPEDDWCAEAGGCLNGGTCYNQCNDYWCDCPTPYTWSKRCERFSCSDDNECYNGGSCDRGETGDGEYRNCVCPDGFYGYQCEYTDDMKR